MLVSMAVMSAVKGVVSSYVSVIRLPVQLLEVHRFLLTACKWRAMGLQALPIIEKSLAGFIRMWKLFVSDPVLVSPEMRIEFEKFRDTIGRHRDAAQKLAATTAGVQEVRLAVQAQWERIKDPEQAALDVLVPELVTAVLTFLKKNIFSPRYLGPLMSLVCMTASFSKVDENYSVDDIRMPTQEELWSRVPSQESLGDMWNGASAYRGNDAWGEDPDLVVIKEGVQDVVDENWKDTTQNTVWGYWTGGRVDRTIQEEYDAGDLPPDATGSTLGWYVAMPNLALIYKAGKSVNRAYRNFKLVNSAANAADITEREANTALELAPETAKHLVSAIGNFTNANRPDAMDALVESTTGRADSTEVGAAYATAYESVNQLLDRKDDKTTATLFVAAGTNTATAAASTVSEIGGSIIHTMSKAEAAEAQQIVHDLSITAASAFTTQMAGGGVSGTGTVFDQEAVKLIDRLGELKGLTENELENAKETYFLTINIGLQSFDQSVIDNVEGNLGIEGIHSRYAIGAVGESEMVKTGTRVGNVVIPDGLPNSGNLNARVLTDASGGSSSSGSSRMGSALGFGGGKPDNVRVLGEDPPPQPEGPGVKFDSPDPGVIVEEEETPPPQTATGPAAEQKTPETERITLNTKRGTGVSVPKGRDNVHDVSYRRQIYITIAVLAAFVALLESQPNTDMLLTPRTHGRVHGYSREEADAAQEMLAGRGKFARDWARPMKKRKAPKRRPTKKRK